MLTIGNTKTAKGEKLGILTGILHLSPGDLSGHQVCPSASQGCLAACLNTAGRGQMTPIQTARIKKTRLFFEDRAAFMQQLAKSIESLIRKAKREGMTPAVRLNGTSDLPWEKIAFGDYRSLFEAFPDVQFYDYTKIRARALKFAKGWMPANYHLTFSATESNHADCEAVAAAGGNVAVVFDHLPETYLGLPVIDGDVTDVRFQDPAGVVVGLKAKGKAKHDTSGFVRKIIPIKVAA